ncbi:hypothetical protein [Sinanaerobacter chloroacetimidivorans]|uniref:Uncharacterized protein n=1 Tax=Sinanaerobacter chloroacetimidivorans TaxID=2818044 RepID=A0A8J7W292_9FIRM|nr:hypothetical protein [Sinanaerobacter chloroacetimidivorans]MBR0599552.1 hypothetical protein [Sinanaerobacter chloroacetimidivorans]
MNMENQQQDFYFEESEKFFQSLKEEFEYSKNEKVTENDELPFWASQR